MTSQITIAQQYNVTELQMSMAHRIVDMAARQVFFQVESQTTAGTEYEVRYNRLRKHLTCTCKAGQEAMTCWHMRAACAVAAEYKAEQERDMAELSAEIQAECCTAVAPYSVEVDETSSSLDGVKFEQAGKDGRLVPMR